MNKGLTPTLLGLLPAEIAEMSSTATSPFSLDRLVEYFGVVNYATTDRVLKEIKEMLAENPQKEVYVTVTSAGGPSGIAMSFYDHIHTILRANLVTIGSGDVDSAGIIIFLSGDRRYVTRNTTMLFHRAGRFFDNQERYTVNELRSFVREDSLKDTQYAEIVAKRSRGRLTTRRVLNLMDQSAVLEPEQLVSLGLADGILG